MYVLVCFPQQNIYRELIFVLLFYSLLDIFKTLVCSNS